MDGEEKDGACFTDPKLFWSRDSLYCIKWFQIRSALIYHISIYIYIYTISCKTYAYLSIYLSIHLSIYRYQSIQPSIHPSIHPSLPTYLPSHTHPSVTVFAWLPAGSFLLWSQALGVGSPPGWEDPKQILQGRHAKGHPKIHQHVALAAVPSAAQSKFSRTWPSSLSCMTWSP